MTRHTVWWSAGAASTMAAWLHMQNNPDADITLVYTDPGGEHPDNMRFKADVEAFLGVEIVVLRSTQYVDPWDVFDSTRYIVGPQGARCTVELKKRLRQQYEDPDDIQVFGYTVEEKNRIERFRKANPDVRLVTPLLKHNVTKAQCLGWLQSNRIELPAMYRLGFQNANCIGCPHGGMGYWNMTRQHFPAHFQRMARLERRIGHAVNKDGNGPVFLDELAPTRGDIRTEPDIECGPLCVDGADTPTLFNQ